MHSEQHKQRPESAAEPLAATTNPYQPYLDQISEQVQVQISAALDAYFSHLHKDVIQPIHQAAQKSANTHAALLADVTAPGTESGTEATDLSATHAGIACAHYRRRATIALLPLLQHLSGPDLSAQVRRYHRVFENTLSQLIEDLPRQWPVMPATPRLPQAPARSWWRRALGRGRRTPSAVGPPSAMLGQHVVAKYVRTYVMPAINVELQRMLKGLSETVLGIEEQLAGWAGEVLLSEIALRTRCDDLPTPLALSTQSSELGSENLDRSEDVPIADGEPVEAGATELWTESQASQFEAVRVAALAMQEMLAQVCSPECVTWTPPSNTADLLGAEGLRQQLHRLQSPAPMRVTPVLSVEGGPSPADRWERWFKQSANRLQTINTLLNLRDSVELARQAFVVNAVEQRGVPYEASLAQALETLELLSEASAKAFESASFSNRYALSRALRMQRDKARRSVDEKVLTPFRNSLAHRALERQFDADTENLRDTLSALPLEIQVHADTATGMASVGARDIALRWAFTQGFNDRFFDARRKVVHDLRAQLDAVSAEVADVVTIVGFNQGAAVEEVRDGIRRYRSDPEAFGTALADARELTTNGLQRAQEVLHAQQGITLVHLRDAAEALFEVESNSWDRILACLEIGHARRSSSTSKSQVTWSNFAHGLNTKCRAGIATGSKVIGYWVGTVRRQGTKVLQWGRSAVGADTAEQEESQDTLEALTRVDQTIAELPVVYRRLFSFYPVRDPSLLKGRQQDVRAVSRHIARRRGGLTDALLLTALHGGGLTSFTNVLRNGVLRDSRVSVLNLSTRIDSEAELVALLANTLSLAPAADTPDNVLPDTLEQLEQRILTHANEDDSNVCIVEHFEHVCRRQINGAELARRVIRLMSRTDACMQWIITSGDFGWQLIKTFEPASAQLVTQHELSPIDRKALEAMIMERHRRSGLALSFEVPRGVNPILRRRLRLSRSISKRQELLQDAFFDRLYARSGQNIMLAFFYWIRSVNIDKESATVHVSQVESLRFDFLDNLSLTHSFALKALLEHVTLTVKEYADVGEMPVTMSEDLFESLRNYALIDVVTDEEGGATDEVQQDEPRYRVRPLIIHPVVEHLRRRNIVH